VKKRKRVPGDLNDRLMVANRHTCCICRQPRHPVEKHHIDEDPSNNEWNNLAVVCRNCHGLISAKGNLGARYSPGEVLRYKQDWEQHCAEAGEDDIDSPVDEIHETRVIEGGSHNRKTASGADGGVATDLRNGPGELSELAADVGCAEYQPDAEIQSCERNAKSGEWGSYLGETVRPRWLGSPAPIRTTF
jgi:hypothetical protein